MDRDNYETMDRDNYETWWRAGKAVRWTAWICPDCQRTIPADEPEEIAHHRWRHRPTERHAGLGRMQAEVDPFSGPEWEDYG